jgi:hypothetical protein
MAAPAEYHRNQLPLLAAQIEHLRNREDPYGPVFKAWRAAVARSLDGAFGSDSPFARQFSNLHFSVARASLGLGPSFDENDQRRYAADLTEARLLLDAAIDEGAVTSMAGPSPRPIASVPREATRRNAEAVELADALLAESELDIASTHRLLMRARRLFELIRDKERIQFVEYELNGYPDHGAELPSLRQAAGRARGQTKLAYQPLPLIEEELAAFESDVTYLRAISNRDTRDQTKFEFARDCATAYKKLRHSVRDWVHREASRAHRELLFGDAAQTIFDEHRSRVDALLRAAVPDAIGKLESISIRTLEANPDALQQALGSCRALIYAAADRLFPPRNEPAVVDGIVHELRADKHLNRLNEYLRTKCTSASRRERLAKTLASIHDGLSKGAKGEINAEEGRSLVLLTYMTLGEILLAASS